MLTALLVALFAPTKADFTKKWVYLATNLLVEKNVTDGIALAGRAAKAGYNGVVVTDSKFFRWDTLDERYAKNVETFRAGVKKSGLEIIVCVAPVGYSNDLLSRDPNLAEGIPVVDQPFVVTSEGTLEPTSDSGEIVNGGFEESNGDNPTGWAWVDAPGKLSFIDKTEHSEGQASLKMVDIGQNGNGRANQKVKVKPFGYYHVSFDVKTQDFDTPGNTNITILGKRSESLQHRSLPIKPTMPWTTIDVTFNSLDNNEVLFYAGVWGGKKGTIWWDNFRIEPAGLVNLVRRPGAPFKVKDAKIGKVLIEGKDFDGAVDPKLGNIAWPGDYDVWHKGPVMTVPKDSQLKPGDRVLVSYSHTALVYDGQVTCCLAEPKVFEIIKWQVQQVHKHLQPDGYMLSHDEIRVGGWDMSCLNGGMTPGQQLATNVKKCAEIVRAEDPNKPVYAWSDMFDPFHNAQPKGSYYLVKGDGPWTGSWLGLDKNIVILNWNMGDEVRQKSLDFFKKRGHRQILAGYYDGGGVDLLKWNDEARGAYGAMYTTWQGKYDDLENFAKAWK